MLNDNLFSNDTWVCTKPFLLELCTFLCIDLVYLQQKISFPTTPGFAPNHFFLRCKQDCCYFTW